MILVVGASGLLGQHVVEQLRRRGHEVTTAARSPADGVDHVLDATTASVADFRDLLAGHDGVVFAAGKDDREVPDQPSYPTFRAGNVESVARLMTAAREAGLTRGVIIGSYYTYFHRQHPEWDLVGLHPYIRSRVEQAEAARVAAGPGLPVAVLELPFVFGRANGRVPNWSPGLDSWVRSRSPLFAPVGGSAATTAAWVAETAVTALEEASGADIPVVHENLTWTELIGRVATAAGRPRPVRRLPAVAVRGALRLLRARHRSSGKQAGIEPVKLGDLLLRELFIEPPEPRSVDAAIAETFPSRS